jgi:hypothetical protein
MLFVVVLICGTNQPQCDAHHYRAYRAYALPEGFAICSLPAVFGQMAESAVGPNDDEYMRVRCEWRPK